MRSPNEWYYRDGAREIGPVPTARLLELITAGRLTEHSLVSANGVK